MDNREFFALTRKGAWKINAPSVLNNGTVILYVNQGWHADDDMDTLDLAARWITDPVLSTSGTGVNGYRVHVYHGTGLTPLGETHP